MLPSQREAIIIGLLQQNEIITIADVCTHCNCSSVTARRDLARLEDQGVLRRTHGGAVQVSAGTPRVVVPNGRSVLEARSALIDRSDVLIVSPNETTAIRQLVERARRAGVAIISESNKYQGATTAISIDNYRAGLELGRWIGEYVREHILGPIKVLDVSYTLPNTEARSRGFADGLSETRQEEPVVLRVNGHGLRATSRQIATDALAVHPDVNVIFGINDDSALGALDAFRAAGLNERQLVLAAVGVEGVALKDQLNDGGPCRASVAMFPELVGRACIDAAVCAYHGCALPERIFTPFAIVTPESLERYYQKDPLTGSWSIRWTSAERLPSASAGYALLGECRGRPKPSRIGYVLDFGSHEWYRNLRFNMQEYSRSLGILLEVVDGSQDTAQEVETLKRAIGRTAARFVNSGDTIILDAGSTTAYLAEALHGKQRLTVITNSLRVLTELAGEAGITLVSSGGMMRQEGLALVGTAAEATFANLRADKAFIGGTGLSQEFGLSNSSMPEASVTQAMLRAAHEVYLLSDHTKIGTESMVKVAPIESIHRLITDAGISTHDRLSLNQRGIEVTIAQEEGG